MSVPMGNVRNGRSGGMRTRLLRQRRRWRDQRRDTSLSCPVFPRPASAGYPGQSSASIPSRASRFTCPGGHGPSSAAPDHAQQSLAAGCARIRLAMCAWVRAPMFGRDRNDRSGHRLVTAANCHVGGNRSREVARRVLHLSVPPHSANLLDRRRSSQSHARDEPAGPARPRRRSASGARRRRHPCGRSCERSRNRPDLPWRGSAIVSAGLSTPGTIRSRMPRPRELRQLRAVRSRSA